MKKLFSGFMKDNRGIGIVELILILVVLIAVILVFKGQIVSIVENAFSAITDNADSIIE